MKPEKLKDFETSSWKNIRGAIAYGSLVYAPFKVGSRLYGYVYDRAGNEIFQSKRRIDGIVLKFKKSVESLALRHDFGQSESWDQDRRGIVQRDISEIFSGF